MDWNTPDYHARMDAKHERIRAEHPRLVTKPFECLAGWFPLIEGYFDEVARLKAERPGSEYTLLQVKEKYGSLRIYAGASDNIYTAVTHACDRASALSLTTFDVCGRPGRVRKRDGWYATRYEEHADGNRASPCFRGELRC